MVVSCQSEMVGGMWPNKIGDEKLVVLGALKTTKEKATQGWLCYYWWVGRDSNLRPTRFKKFNWVPIEILL